MASTGKCNTGCMRSHPQNRVPANQLPLNPTNRVPDFLQKALPVCTARIPAVRRTAVNTHELKGCKRTQGAWRKTGRTTNAEAQKDNERKNETVGTLDIARVFVSVVGA